MSVLSVIENTDSLVEIILLTMDLSERDERYIPFDEEQLALLKKTLKEKNPESDARIIDVTNLQHEYFDGGKNQKNNYTPYASIRLFLDLLDVPEKMIYLDADIMVRGNIEELYSIDIQNHEFAAVKDIVGRKFFPKKYCNSGVLLLNLKKIKETGLFRKCCRLVRRRPMMMPD
jgi:lipopolysaccharide biosynthesis glycosyltransferase